MHPDDREAHVADYLAAVGEHRAWNHQNRMRRHDGEWRWFDNHAQPLFGAGGEYLGHVAASVDITESKRADDALAESAVRLQTAVVLAEPGIGLEADDIGRIFRPFEQASVSITREFGGLGLGLAIAKATVDAHGGTLRVSSAGPGQGATFTVDLPSGGEFCLPEETA